MSDLTIVNSDGSRNIPEPTKCEAIGCDARVQYRMALMVGKQSSISIFLCKNCGSKFCSVDDSMRLSKVPGASYDGGTACYPTTMEIGADP